MTDDGIDRDALMRVFLAEAEENVAAMEDSLVALESTPQDDAVIATIFRAAHTLKGNCASVGLESVVELAHAAEDLLDELRSHRFPVTADLITLLLRTADALKTLIPQAAAAPEEAPSPDATLIEALRQSAATGRWLPDLHPAETTAPGAPQMPAAARASTVRVQTRKLDLLLNAISELTIARGRVRALAGIGTDAEDALDHLDALTDRIQDLVLQTRMVPIGGILRQQVRTVRDLATREGKVVTVDVAGEDVELDTSVVDRLRDALIHIVRNAVDHGIETAEARRAANKNTRATLTLRAAHREGMIVVEVADDGAGIDHDRLRERARAMHIGVDGLSERELLRLILLPGFSTATKVTEVSGRGIGLDVVEKNISAVGGFVNVESVLGKGTTFTIRLPLTVAVLHGLSARIGSELYIVPMPAVAECLDLPSAETNPGLRSGMFSLRGEPLPFLRLRHHFQTPSDPSALEKLVVVEYNRRRAALVVDEVIGETRAVVKPMSRLFRRSTWISGSALLGSGEIGLVLEVASILDDAVKDMR